ncbi:MAG: DUF1080 domain-containing protein, partial [Sedimentisphaerales bacterium]|nr:DUF1080 domain-containing protein [Sedimentisphaerales bacterium]
EIQQCATFFRQASTMLNPSGWKDLLAGDLSNCTGKWRYAGGVLEYAPGGNFFVNDVYHNFILDLEFKLASQTNSGIFIRNADHQTWQHRGMEIQIADSHGQPVDTHICGAVYDCQKPSSNPTGKPGVWNRLTIAAAGPRIEVVMNGVRIIEMDLTRWTIPGKNPDNTDNKFPQAMKDLDRPGYIGFQDHGQAVWYRHIRIKPLP